jgi:hypothetical protein
VPTCRNHRIQWDKGKLLAVDHADARTRSDCLRLVRNWDTYCKDQDVLAIGPRTTRERLRRPRDSDRHKDLLELFGLGPGFALRLTAKAALAVPSVPVLTAALSGRLAPVAAAWAGIDPSQVDVSILDHGWAELELTGSGRLRAAVRAEWLARVWAPGLAVIDGKLVVEVTEITWPTGKVLAQARPGDTLNYWVLDVRYRRGRWMKRWLWRDEWRSEFGP